MATGTTPQPRIALTATDIKELAAGFAALAPTRVLWPLKERALPDGVRIEELPLGDNTMVVPWVDYNVSNELPAVMRARCLPRRVGCKLSRRVSC
jgi:hypothetical protein